MSTFVKNQNRGVSLVWVVIFATIIMVIVTALTSATISELRMSTGADFSAQAYAAAQAGIEAGSLIPNCDPSVNNQVVTIATNTTYTLTLDGGSPVCGVDSVGTVAGVSRKIHSDVTNQDAPTNVITYPGDIKSGTTSVVSYGGSGNYKFEAFEDTVGGLKSGNLGQDFTQQFDLVRNNSGNYFAPVGTGMSGGSFFTVGFNDSIGPNKYATVYYYDSDDGSGTVKTQNINFGAGSTPATGFRVNVNYQAASNTFVAKVKYQDASGNYHCLGSTTVKFTNGHTYTFNKSLTLLNGPSPAVSPCSSGTYSTCFNSGGSSQLVNPGSGIAINAGAENLSNQYSFLENMVYTGTKQQYYITGIASPTTGGSVSSGWALSGTNYTVTATNNPGYAFVNWSPGDCTGSNPSFIITNVSGPKSCTANFIHVYNVATAPVPTQGGSVTGGGDFNAGSSVTLTATPSSGYYLINWFGDCTGGTSTYTITNLQASKSCSANFGKSVNFETGLFSGWGWHAPTVSGLYSSGYDGLGGSPVVQSANGAPGPGWAPNNTYGGSYSLHLWGTYLDKSCTAGVGAAYPESGEDSYVVLPVTIPQGRTKLDFFEAGSVGGTGNSQNNVVFVETRDSSWNLMWRWYGKSDGVDTMTVSHTGTAYGGWHEYSTGDLSGYAGQTIYMYAWAHNGCWTAHLLLDDIRLVAD